MTETEAKTKWCPFTQMQTGHVAIGNRIANGEPMPGANCIASACMLWRVSNWAEKGGEHSGYCGLAGKP